MSSTTPSTGAGITVPVHVYGSESPLVDILNVTDQDGNPIDLTDPTVSALAEIDEGATLIGSWTISADPTQTDRALLSMEPAVIAAIQASTSPVWWDLKIVVNGSAAYPIRRSPITYGPAVTG